MANNPAAENVCSASNDIGGMVNKALNNCSNLLGLFSVASSSFIFCLITVGMFNVCLKSSEKTFMLLVFVSIVSQLYIFVLILTFFFITVIFSK